MAKRVAFFAQKQEIEKYYNIETNKESLFEAHYNLSPGHQLPTIFPDDGDVEIHRVRWGKSENSKTIKTTIERESVLDNLENESVRRCILPLSGFFIWKEDEEKNHPFFVRLLNNSVMSIAGIYHDFDQEFVSIITTEANTLVQPMSDLMPLMLDRPLALQWLDPGIDTDALLEKAQNLFLLTDLSVLRVSKEVNDPSKNKPELIQPIPK